MLVLIAQGRNYLKLFHTTEMTKLQEQVGRPREPKVAVCITTYNGGDYLRQMLLSLVDQTFKDFILYIYDDGSNDGTDEIIENFKDRLNIRYFFTSGIHNIGSVKNRVVKAALRDKPDLIQMLDHDDLIEPTFLEEMIKKIEEGFDFVVCNGVMFGEACAQIKNKVPDYETIIKDNTLTSWGMFKREVLEQQNFRRGLAHFEDWDLYIRLIKLGFKCGVVEEELYNYRMHPGQFHRETQKDFYKHRRNLWELHEIEQ